MKKPNRFLEPSCHVCHGMCTVKLYGRAANGEVCVINQLPCEACDGTGFDKAALIDRIITAMNSLPHYKERRA